MVDRICADPVEGHGPGKRNIRSQSEILAVLKAHQQHQRERGAGSSDDKAL